MPSFTLKWSLKNRMKKYKRLKKKYCMKEKETDGKIHVCMREISHKGSCVCHECGNIIFFGPLTAEQQPLNIATNNSILSGEIVEEEKHKTD